MGCGQAPTVVGNLWGMNFFYYFWVPKKIKNKNKSFLGKSFLELGYFGIFYSIRVRKFGHSCVVTK
jgi:hypothetical protein